MRVAPHVKSRVLCIVISASTPSDTSDCPVESPCPMMLSSEKVPVPALVQFPSPSHVDKSAVYSPVVAPVPSILPVPEAVAFD